MVNNSIRENLKRIRTKIYNKQRDAIQSYSYNNNQYNKNDENEIFILEEIFDNWYYLYNEDNAMFWKDC